MKQHRQVSIAPLCCDHCAVRHAHNIDNAVTPCTHSCCDARFERGVAEDRLGGMSVRSRKH